MKFTNLDKLLSNESGAFICNEINDPKNTKTIAIGHQADPALSEAQIELLKSEVGHIPGLIDFYRNYSNVHLFRDPVSGDTAYYIASPENWINLWRDFEPWIADIDPDEKDLIPTWIENCCVIGERPGTGNYFLLATDGQCSGNVFEFEHDGFEFDLIAEDFPRFIDYLVAIDEDRLSDIASALRFVDDRSASNQWYISEFRYNSKSISLDRKGLGYKLKILFTQDRLTSKSKTTEVAKFNLPTPDSHGCSTIDHTEIKLPNDKFIVLCCEMNKSGSSLQVSDPGEHVFNGARIGGTPWFSVRSENGLSIRYTLDDSTEMFFDLSE